MPREVRMLDDVRPDESDHEFLPGMSRGWLMPWYDLTARFRRLDRLYRRTVELAAIGPGQRVLDVGCGTGNLSRAVLRAVPDAAVTGLDPDGESLRRAARKLRRRRSGDVTLVRGFAHRLPVPDASQDHVVSSLALHHVPAEEKERLAAEVARVLRPGGRVTVTDFGGDHASAHGHGPSSARDGGRDRHRPGTHGRRPGHGPGSGTHDADNADGGIERLLTEAGLADARTLERMPILGDSVVFVQARRP
ncbi:methyltransferase family protein [Isoptericola sp. CG 20/1183]|uniref:Methyltransferase family protein n=1 Tax=Isoptericola halotolerans TaxID=300560 RepID=A0ABX5EGP9_9MICO|nr:MULTISPECIES: methyltransferase domain-containing protein [Isoptericola]PRZ08665.1 methyltransferase family protein [Isoptericola halotolerans]PRZ10888.1 methyltransferase family protein [Isoptericola sp. CG 20/1183]